MASADDFLTKTLLQAQINRARHGDDDKEEPRSVTEWALIAAEHMGHLMGAVLKDDPDTMEKEILHVAAPLLELHDALRRAARQGRN